MSLRIAVVAACPYPARRGTPLRIERLTEALIARGHEVEVVSYHLCDAPSAGGYRLHRIYKRTEVEPLAPGPTWSKLAFYDPALSRLLRRVLRNAPFDVIHAHHYEGLLAACWARRGTGTPVVYDAHTMLASELPSYWPYRGSGMIRKLGVWLDRRIPRMADHVLTVTRDIRDRLVNDHDMLPSQVDVAMNGVEVDHFTSSANCRPADPGRVIYTGTLAGYQGFDVLLDAFAIARKARPQMRLMVAASSSFGPFEKKVRDLGIRDAIDLEADNFEMLPNRLASSTMAVLPRADCDGIPQKLLNYMAAGKAIVACAGSAKLLKDGENGLVVPNHDASAFAEAMIRLHDDRGLVQRLGQAARDLVVADCSWDHTASICESAYRRLITPRDSRGKGGESARDGDFDDDRSDSPGLSNIAPIRRRPVSSSGEHSRLSS